MLEKGLPNILDLSRFQLKELIESLGDPAYRSDQILSWIYKILASSFEEMTNLPLSFARSWQLKRLYSAKTLARKNITG